MTGIPDNVIHGYFPKLSAEVAPQTRPTAELGGKPYGHLRRLPNFVRDPSMGSIEALLAQAPEVLGVVDECGRVLLFASEDANHANAAAAMGMPDPAASDFPGAVFTLRTMDDWFSRKRPPTRERRISLEKRKQEREQLAAHGKMLPDRLP